MSQIEFDFYTVRAQKERAGELNRTLRELADGEYEETMQSLKLSWEGENAGLFLAKMEELRERMAHTAGLLGQAQTKLEEACKCAEAMEREAAETAKSSLTRG